MKWQKSRKKKYEHISSETELKSFCSQGLFQPHRSAPLEHCAAVKVRDLSFEARFSEEENKVCIVSRRCEDILFCKSDCFSDIVVQRELKNVTGVYNLGWVRQGATLLLECSTVLSKFDLLFMFL